MALIALSCAPYPDKNYSTEDLFGKIQVRAQKRAFLLAKNLIHGYTVPLPHHSAD
jgi:hypothetical protein